MTARTLRELPLLVVSALLLLAGAVLGILLFAAPYDTIADEEVYLDQYFSVLNGPPLGWNIRSFFYPLLLLPSRLAAAALGLADPASMTLAARIANYAVGVLGLYWAYRLAERLWGRTEAVLTVALIVGSAFWLVQANRFMMDVPSTSWLVGAAAVVALGVDRPSRAVWVVVLGSLAVFTKFQTAPAVLGVALWAVASQAASGQRSRLLLWGLGTAVAMTILFGAVDWLIYGQSFASLFNFVDYNMLSPEAFAAKYGSCEPPLFYLTAVPAVYSWIVPGLTLAGVISVLIGRSRAAGLLLIVAVYTLVLSGLCHKQDRYLMQITPFVLALAAHGVVVIAGIGALALRSAVLGPMLGAGLAVLAWLSLVPRNEVRVALARSESCASFVYALHAEGKLPAPGTGLGLAVPCGMPRYYLGGVSAVDLDDGYSEETRLLAHEQIRKGLEEGVFSAVIASRNSTIDRMVRDRWGARNQIVSVSPKGGYHHAREAER